VYCGPFVLSNVEAWTARNTLAKRVNEKSRAPFDKLRTNGIFHRQTALFRIISTPLSQLLTSTLTVQLNANGN